MWTGFACMFIGYLFGLAAGEFRVKTFWEGFTVSTIALAFAIGGTALTIWLL